MKKWIVMLISLLLLVGAYLTFWSLGANQETSQKSVQNLKIGQTYQTNDFTFKLIDQKHFITLDDHTDYANQDELDEALEDDEDDYPWLTVYEGEYKRDGSNIYLRPTSSATLDFDDVKSIKQKAYANIDKETYQEDFPKTAQLQKTKTGYYYLETIKSLSINEEKTPIYHSKKTLPDSLEAFLKNYHASNN